MTARLRIALIASSRYPISEPFAGGLEAQTWALADGLRRRGHDVSLFAAPGSDAALGVRELAVRPLSLSDHAVHDVSMPEAVWMAEHHAYLTLMLDLMTDGSRYDVIHNNSLHHLPVAMAGAVATPIVTTLHTPPTPWLESAVRAAPCPVSFYAVSESTADLWRPAIPDVRVVRNGIDLDRWHVGPGGGPLVWFGRMVPEKGPDLAIRAASRAGVALQLAGPVSDPAFFASEVEPLLTDRITYVGHLDREGLVSLIGGARAVVVTPRWDEPYGLVAAEALSCGTPVIGFARGGLPEVVDPSCSVLVPADDVTALAATIPHVDRLSRTAARARAEQACSMAVMLDRYEDIYLDLVGGGVLAA